jgi:hypothetical protein
MQLSFCVCLALFLRAQNSHYRMPQRFISDRCAVRLMPRHVANSWAPPNPYLLSLSTARTFFLLPLSV